GGERREAFSRFLTNKVRRKGFGWKEYVDLLDEREVDMSANTETQLATELQAKGGPNDAVVNDTRAVAFVVLDSANEKKNTLNLLFLRKILTSPWTSLRNAHDKARDKSLQDEDLILADDLAKHPTTTHNARGELKLFDEGKTEKNHVGLKASEFQKYRNYLDEDKRMNKLAKLKKEEKKEKRKKTCCSMNNV
ncbi:unnamed protein product, partial [Cylindrotheca closterium]